MNEAQMTPQIKLKEDEYNSCAVSNSLPLYNLSLERVYYSSEAQYGLCV